MSTKTTITTKTVLTDLEKDLISPTSTSVPPTPRPRNINDNKLLLKIDLSILPILFCAYFLQFLDKVVYNVSILHRSVDAIH
jgi:hypothetical protein